MSAAPLPFPERSPGDEGVSLGGVAGSGDLRAELLKILERQGVALCPGASRENSVGPFGNARRNSGVAFFPDRPRQDLKDELLSWGNGEPRRISALSSFISANVGVLSPEVVAKLALACDIMIQKVGMEANVAPINWSAILLALKDELSVSPRDSVWILNVINRAFRERPRAGSGEGGGSFCLDDARGSIPFSDRSGEAARHAPAVRRLLGTADLPLYLWVYLIAEEQLSEFCRAALAETRFLPDSLFALCLFDRFKAGARSPISPAVIALVSKYAIHSELAEARSWLRHAMKSLSPPGGMAGGAEGAEGAERAKECVSEVSRVFLEANVYCPNLWAALEVAYPSLDPELKARSVAVATRLLSSGDSIERYVVSFLSHALSSDREARRQAISRCLRAGRSPGRLWDASFATADEISKFRFWEIVALLSKLKIPRDVAKTVMSRLTASDVAGSEPPLVEAHADDMVCQADDACGAAERITEVLMKYGFTGQEVRSLSVFPWLEAWARGSSVLRLAYPESFAIVELAGVMLSERALECAATGGSAAPEVEDPRCDPGLLADLSNFQTREAMKLRWLGFANTLSHALAFISSEMSSGQESVEKYVSLANLCSRKLDSFEPFSLKFGEALILVKGCSSEGPETSVLVAAISSLQNLVEFGISLFAYALSWNREVRSAEAPVADALERSPAYALWPYAPFFFMLASRIIRRAHRASAVEGGFSGFEIAIGDAFRASGCLWEALGWIAFLQGRPAPPAAVSVADLRPLCGYRWTLRGDVGGDELRAPGSLWRPSGGFPGFPRTPGGSAGKERPSLTVGAEKFSGSVDSGVEPVCLPFSREMVKHTRFNHDPKLRFTCRIPAGVLSPSLEDLLSVFPFLALKDLLDFPEMGLFLGWRTVIPVLLTACMCQGSAMTTRLFTRKLMKLLRELAEKGRGEAKERAAVFSYVDLSLLLISRILEEEELPFTEVRGAYTISELISGLLKLSSDVSGGQFSATPGRRAMESFLADQSAAAFSLPKFDDLSKISKSLRHKALIALYTLEQCVLCGLRLNFGCLLERTIPLLDSKDYSVANAARRVFSALYRTSMGPRRLLETEFSRFYSRSSLQELCSALSGPVTASFIASVEVLCHVIPWSAGLISEQDACVREGKGSSVLPRKIHFEKLHAWLHHSSLKTFSLLYF